MKFCLFKNCFFLTLILIFLSCQNDKSETKNYKYDVITGKGLFKSMNFNPSDTILAQKGYKLYVKHCISCHLYNSKRSIGPSWQGITERHHPLWILNFICNTEEMLKFDPYLKKQIKEYKLHMPNLYIDTNDAVSIYSYMYLKDNE